MARLWFSAALLLLTACAQVGKRERLYPPLGRFVEVDGSLVHVLERGEGTPIVFLHGAYGGLDDFDATVFDALAPEGRLVALDRPGHGWSERGDGPSTPVAQAHWLARTLAALEIERPLIVGFSWGGALALAFALEYPERARGLVLLSPVTHALHRRPDPVYYVPAVPLFGPLMSHTLLPLAAHFLAPLGVARVFAPEPVPASFERSPLPLAVTPRRFAANTADLRHLDAALAAQSRRYYALSLPITVLFGEEDPIAPPLGQAYALKRDAPQTRLLPLPRAGHQILFSRTDDVVDSIRAALAATTGTGR